MIEINGHIYSVTFSETHDALDEGTIITPTYKRFDRFEEASKFFNECVNNPNIKVVFLLTVEGR